MEDFQCLGKNKLPCILMNSSLDAYKQRLSELLDDLKVNSVLHRRLEKMSEELLSLKDPGSRIFTHNTLQCKMYYSPAKGMMEWNVTSLVWLCCLELPAGVLFGGTFEVMKGNGGEGAGGGSDQAPWQQLQLLWNAHGIQARRCWLQRGN